MTLFYNVIHNFDYVAAILDICKLNLPHGKSSSVPPYFAFPMSSASQILQL